MSVPNVITGILDFHREQVFPGMTLKIFEMTPNGHTQILELSSGWCPRRPDEKEGLAENFWYVDIFHASLTDVIKKKAALWMIGTYQFKNVKFPPSLGKHGIYTISGELMTG